MKRNIVFLVVLLIFTNSFAFAEVPKDLNAPFEKQTSVDACFKKGEKTLDVGFVFVNDEQHVFFQEKFEALCAKLSENDWIQEGVVGSAEYFVEIAFEVDGKILDTRIGRVQELFAETAMEENAEISFDIQNYPEAVLKALEEIM
ncbi:MAG: hypothetical protein ABFQ53_03870 [Patescibacteria group bacterium]